MCNYVHERVRYILTIFLCEGMLVLDISTPP
jgi:hypothetical protein